jgi:hypothetical protein
MALARNTTSLTQFAVFARGRGLASGASLGKPISRDLVAGEGSSQVGGSEVQAAFCTSLASILCAARSGARRTSASATTVMACG